MDYNWEYPRNQKEWDGLFALIAETKEKFAPHNFVITMAYYPDTAQEAQVSFFSFIDVNLNRYNLKL